MTVTPEPSAPAAVVLSLDGITVQDAAGTTLQSSAFDDPDGTLELLELASRVDPDADRVPRVRQHHVGMAGGAVRHDE